MEPREPGGRQSGILSLINHEKVEHINIDRANTSSNMAAAAALVSPTSMYSNNPLPLYSTGWPAPPSYPVSGLISPPESRRTSDNKTEPPPPIQTNPPHRQSLPSIHEALNSASKSNAYASPVSASLHPSQHQLPYSHIDAENPSRTYASEPAPLVAHLGHPQARHPSPPQPVHPRSGPFGRSESIPTPFSDSRHSSLTSLQAAPGPPPNPYAARPYEQVRYEQIPRVSERIPNGYTHQPQGQYTYGTGPQISPAGYHPSFTEPRYQPSRDPREPIDPWKMGEEEKPGFKIGLKRHLETWDFENNLAQIDIASSNLQEWSRHYNLIAQEQSRPIPDRMPSLDACEEMVLQGEKIMQGLHRMKEIIRQQEYAMADQRQRHDGVKVPGDYDDEMSIYGDDLKNQGFGGSESKKRRGRAAPPGRCHSCNRAETPEWRRGPDGARTLCNACGLHYAKLTRKNTIKQSQGGSNGTSLRPKSSDSLPRP